ncbi:MAG: zinc ribbon domain-containing protein [Dehalococcoidia bacterium]
MPIYEYLCGTCGEKFELRRGINDRDSELRCPKCGASNPQRVLSLFATSSPAESCAPSGST